MTRATPQAAERLKPGGHLLLEISPMIHWHVCEIVAADEAYLAAQTQASWETVLDEQEPGWLRLHRERWRGLPLSLRRRTLRHALH